MKFVIRHSLFETNSSSSHSFSLTTKSTIDSDDFDDDYDYVVTFDSGFKKLSLIEYMFLRYYRETENKDDEYIITHYLMHFKNLFVGDPDFKDYKFLADNINEGIVPVNSDAPYDISPFDELKLPKTMVNFLDEIKKIVLDARYIIQYGYSYDG